MSSATEPTPLNYTTETPRKRRRIWIIAALLFAALVLLLIDWSQPIWRWRLPFLSVQRTCMSFVRPPGTVAYEEDRGQARRLSNGARSGPTWTTLSEMSGNILAYFSYSDLPVRYWYPETGFRVQPIETPLLIHSRRAGGGDVRLIFVGVNPIFQLRANSEKPSPFIFPSALDWQVVKPATLFSPPQALANGSWGDPAFSVATPKPLCIYAGQPDPADESHFSITYRLPRGIAVIDGWLQKDDHLKFKIRSTPSTFLSAPDVQ